MASRILVTWGYLDALERFAAAGGGHLDSDTAVSSGSFETAARAAGCGLAAIESLERGDADAAFVAVRPPGHHATRERGQGFCLLNNVAIRRVPRRWLRPHRAPVVGHGNRVHDAGVDLETEPPTSGGPGRATVDLVARVRIEQFLADT